MKKMVSLILALILALGCFGAALADLSPAQVVGVWYLQSRVKSGDEFIMDADYRLELKRNKTALFVMDGVEREFTWEIKGDTVRLGKPEGAEYRAPTSALYLEDDLLKMDNEYDFSKERYETFDFVFGREKVEIELPQWEHSAQTEDDFFGDYELYMISVPRDKTFQMVEEDTARVAISFAEAKIEWDGSETVIMTDILEDDDGVKLVADGSALSREFKNIRASLSMDEGVMVVDVLNEEEEATAHLYFQLRSEGAVMAEAAFQTIAAIVESLTPHTIHTDVSTDDGEAVFFGDYELKSTYDADTGKTTEWPKGEATATVSEGKVNFVYGRIKGEIETQFADGKLSLDGSSFLGAAYKNLTVETTEDESVQKLNVLKDDGSVRYEILFQRAE